MSARVFVSLLCGYSESFRTRKVVSSGPKLGRAAGLVLSLGWGQGTPPPRACFLLPRPPWKAEEMDFASHRQGNHSSEPVSSVSSVWAACCLTTSILSESWPRSLCGVALQAERRPAPVSGPGLAMTVWHPVIVHRQRREHRRGRWRRWQVATACERASRDPPVTRCAHRSLSSVFMRPRWAESQC